MHGSYSMLKNVGRKEKQKDQRMKDRRQEWRKKMDGKGGSFEETWCESLIITITLTFPLQSLILRAGGEGDDRG